MIELLPSSGIFVYSKHIREVEHKGNGKRIARYLLSCFYTASELVAAGNLTGANFKKGLDPGIVETIVGNYDFIIYILKLINPDYSYGKLQNEINLVIV